VGRQARSKSIRGTPGVSDIEVKLACLRNVWIRADNVRITEQYCARQIISSVSPLMAIAITAGVAVRNPQLEDRRKRGRLRAFLRYSRAGASQNQQKRGNYSSR
jgi:hypothetical protein